MRGRSGSCRVAGRAPAERAPRLRTRVVCQGCVRPAAFSCSGPRTGSSFAPGAGGGRMIGRHIIGGKRPLGRGAKRQQCDGEGEENGAHRAQDKRRLRQRKKDGTNIFGDARAGRPVTQLVLKLSAGGFHLNRSTRIDATPAGMLLRLATFLEKSPQTPAACCLQAHFDAPLPGN